MWGEVRSSTKRPLLPRLRQQHEVDALLHLQLELWLAELRCPELRRALRRVGVRGEPCQRLRVRRDRRDEVAIDAVAFTRAPRRPPQLLREPPAEKPALAPGVHLRLRPERPPLGLREAAPKKLQVLRRHLLRMPNRLSSSSEFQQRGIPLLRAVDLEAIALERPPRDLEVEAVDALRQGEIAHRWMSGHRLVGREALGQIHALIHPAAIDVQQRHGNGMQQHDTPRPRASVAGRAQHRARGVCAGGGF